MMKHEVMATKPLALSSTKELPKKSLWKSRSSSEAPTPKSPITKAFDFLPWSRSKKAAEKSAKSGDSKGKTDLSPTSPNPADDKNKDTLHYQRNIFRNGGELIRDILGERLNKDERSPKKSNVRRARQVTTRNKSLDINELINCVEKELNASSSGDIKFNSADARSHRFLDDTFIENIMRAKEAYHRNLQDEEEAGDSIHRDRGQEYHDYHHSSRLNYNDTDDEYYYHQQQELAQLYRHSEPFRCQDNYNMGAAHRGNGGSGSISPKHILFNDENIVYLIKKEQPVSKSLRNCDKERKPQMDNIVKARLKFKKLSDGPASSSSSPRQADYKSTVLNNNRVIAQHDKLATARRSILQRQNTNPEDLNVRHRCTSPDGFRKRSPSAGRYQTPSLQHKFEHDTGYSTYHQRRKSLTEGIVYDHSPTPLHEGNANGGNSSTSSMGSGASTSCGGILNDRPKTDKPRKKLSFREPVVAEKRRSRRTSAEVVSVTTNGINVQATGNGTANCDNLVDNNRKTTPSQEPTMSTEEELLQSQAMRIVRTVGQAFEVCHKFNIHKNSPDHTEDRSDVSSSELLDVDTRSDQQLSDDDGHNNKKAVTPDLNVAPQRPNHLELMPQTNLSKSGSLLTDEDKSPTSPSSPSREINKLKDQLEQQAMQTRQALGQLMLVREQLISETNARIEAQARTQQLLQQNRELLEHLASLGAYTEQQAPGLTTANIGMAPQLSSTAKVARWFQQLPWNNTASLSRPESGFVSGDSRSEKFLDDQQYFCVKDTEDLCDEFLLVEGSSTIWTKLSAKKRRKLLGMRLGKVTTF